MQRPPLEESLNPNSTSPFANLKDDPSSEDTCDPIWRRTRSFTEGVAMNNSEEDENVEQSVGPAATALHASFDAALLQDDSSEKGSIFRTVKRGRGVGHTASWDGHDSSRSSDIGELSGRKHLRVPPVEGEADMVAPGTVRKHPRTDISVPPKSETNTPGRRFPPGSAMKKLTPSSAARRRRTPMKQRCSPRLQQKRVSSGVPPTPPSIRFPDPSTTVLSPTTPKATLFGMTPNMKPPPSRTPTRATPAFPQTTLKARKSYASFTGTTANTSFDSSLQTTTTDGSASPTPFRFTTFPASLPRVNNPRTADRGYGSPSARRVSTSMRKNAPVLDGENDCGDADMNVKPSSHSQYLSHNCSRDDEGTHNSSLSSWSNDGGHHLPPPAAPSFPPTVLEWKSPEDDGTKPAVDTMLTDGEPDERLGAASSVHAKLFVYEEDDACGPSDEESMQSPCGSQVTRTRLNFNEDIERVGGQNTNADKHRDGNRRMDLSSSASTKTALFDGSGCDEETTGSTSATTPSRPDLNSRPLFSRGEGSFSPAPNDVEFPFRMDSQCSPIPGFPDEEGIHHTLQSSRASQSSSASACDMDIDYEPSKPSGSSQAGKSRPPLIPASSPRKRPQREVTGIDTVLENDESSRLSLSQESDESGSTTSSKMRRLRPMPDMSAFDPGASLRSGSTVNSATEDSPGSSERRQPSSSPKLVCPPTPVRTPAWAHTVHGQHPVFQRSNSLITTKVLATCPIQVLDGHSSLENSLLDDDDDDGEPDTFAPRFPPVAEEAEGHFEFDEMLTREGAPPLTRLSRHASAPIAKIQPPPDLQLTNSCSPRVPVARTEGPNESIPVPPKPLSRLSSGFGEVGSVISFADDFENLGKLGSGTFADVFKVRSRLDGQLYAVKRNRRQFRGKRDREMALAEVRIMQQLQSVCATPTSAAAGSKAKEKTMHSLYVLFFFQAWQEEGYFFCQTELCCRDTCRELMQSLRADWSSASKKYPSLRRHLDLPDSEAANMDEEALGRLMPEIAIWKICHDVAAGLSHVHAHRVVHNDIKPSNVFFIAHSRLGAMGKIGDFGMAGNIGTVEDGQEGDTVYMAPELLSSSVKHPSADIFSLGLSLYELASAVTWELPSEGPRWIELRSGSHIPELPESRSKELSQLIQSMIHPVPEFRPTADDILNKVEKVKEVGARCDAFLRDYIKDIEEHDRIEEQRIAVEQMEADERGQTPRNAGNTKRLFRFDSGPMTSDAPVAPILFTPEADGQHAKHT